MRASLVPLASFLLSSLLAGCPSPTTTDVGSDASSPPRDVPATLDAPSGYDVPGALDAPATDAPRADAPLMSDAGGADAPLDVPGIMPTGTPGCTSDAMCAGNVCWDFREHDMFCFGTVCSVNCDSNAMCIEAARTAGAGTPEAATCGTDFQCDFVGTGLGAFACA